MKANEAPKKIYLTKNLLGELFDRWSALPYENFIGIEYIRTDVFIKMACEWINEYTVLSDKWIIEDFKKYLEEQV